MTDSKKIFFPNLDGLRFIAFFMVFLWHGLKHPFEMLEVKNIYLQKLFYLFANGKTGVSVFFVLSGFLITYLILSEIGLRGKLDVIKFYIRRSLRIWPLYFLLLVLLFGVMPFVMRLTHQDWSFSMNPWYYFAFLSNFDVLHIYLTNGKDMVASTVTWSVSIEEQFYLVWPLLFSFCGKRFYKFIFPAVFFTGYLFRFLHAGNTSILYYHTLSVCGDLALGGWAAYLSFTSVPFLSFFKQQKNTTRALFYVSGIVSLYLLQLTDNGYIEALGRMIQTAFFCYIILDQNFAAQTKGKLMQNRFLSFWGKYTYGLYLWHAFVLMIVTIGLTKILHFSLTSPLVHVCIAAIGLVLSLLVSYFSYHWYEMYFLKLKEKFAFIKKS
jgi:peptidoglycan/LPS O-acetylase OafA/YrhL